MKNPIKSTPTHSSEMMNGELHAYPSFSTKTGVINNEMIAATRRIAPAQSIVTFFFHVLLLTHLLKK